MAEGKKKSKLANFIIFSVVYALIGAIIGYFVAMLVTGNISNGFTFEASLIGHPATLVGAGLGILFEILQAANLLGKPKEKKPADDYSKKAPSEKQFFEGKLLTADQIKAKYATARFSALEKLDLSKMRDPLGEPYKGAGIPIRVAFTPNKKDLEVSLAAPIHTMVVGNTGSGKGQSFINPTIQILSSQASRPSMVISDSKGELYRDHSIKLRQSGYKVVTFDLMKPFESERWNPLDRAYLNYTKMLKLKELAFVHRTGTPAEAKLKYKTDAHFGSVWYEFDGGAYENEEELKASMRGAEQALAAAVSSDVADLCTVIVPEGDAKDKMWADGCRDLCKAVLFAMLEDLKYPETGMTHDKLNLYNFYKIINYRDSGDDPFYTIGRYLDGRSPLFQVRELSNTVLSAADTTKMSYVSVLGTNIGFLADPGIAYITSGSDIDFRTFDDVSTALFLKKPDDKANMDKIAAMALTQLYKDLTDLSRKQPTLALKHFCFFVIDEFASLPKIEGMSNWITISRSRNIIFILVLQSYEQLSGKYGDKDAATIKSNCNIHVFIGSGDEKTTKEFSDKCGTTTVKVDNSSTSESKGKEGKGQDSKSVSKSFSYQQRPLVFPEELRLVEKGNAYFILDKQAPFKSTMVQSYQCGDIYSMKSAAEEFRPAKFLDVEKLTYDMNSYINMKRGSSSTQHGLNILGKMGGSGNFGGGQNNDEEDDY